MTAACPAIGEHTWFIKQTRGRDYRGTSTGSA